MRSIENIGRVPSLTDLLKFRRSFCIIDIRITLDDLNQFELNSCGNLARAA
jgi:hypothetical protein